MSKGSQEVLTLKQQSSTTSKPKNDLLGIFISEFDDKVGKQIIEATFDENQKITKQEFDQVAEYIVPKDELCGKLLVVDFRQDYCILTLPTLIKNEKIYKRKKFIFSVSLVISKSQIQKMPTLCQEITRKISKFVAQLELDYIAVYNNQNDKLNNLLQQIHVQMNSESRECYIEFDSSHYLFIKFIDNLNLQNLKLKVYEHEVPIPKVNIDLIKVCMDQYNPTLFLVYSEIDGQKCVRKIADDLQMPLKELNLYLLNLLEYQLIQFVDIFRFSNHYSITPKIHEFMKNEALKRECLEYIVKDEFKIKEARIEDAISLYLQLQSQYDLQHLVDQSKNLKKFNKFNIVEFIHYGLINGIIQRTYEYPILQRRQIFDLEDYKNIPMLYKDKSPETITKEDLNILNQSICEMIDKGSCLDEVLIHFQITRDIFQKGDNKNQNKNFIIYK